jgi:hypothetical protein
MTGADMRRALLRGEEMQIDSRAPGGIYRTGEKIRRDGVLSSKFDQGHEFDTSKKWTELFTFVNLYSSGHRLRYEGPLDLSLGAGTTFPGWNSIVSDKQTSRLHALGNRAISESSPTAPEAGLVTLVGELSSLPLIPGLQSFRSFTPRSAGSEYLNVEFGIKPLIRDIQTLAQAVLSSKKLVEQYRRDAGRVVRRRRFLVDGDVQTSVQVDTPILLGIPRYYRKGSSTPYSATTFFAQTSPRGIVHTRTSEDVWFSGAFSYFLEETDTLLGKLSAYEQMANRLLGGRLDASAVWELTPWSWLIDWFADISSFVGRVNRLSSDSLVLRYGYVMHHVHHEVTLMLPNQPTRFGQVVPTPQLTFHGDVKRRVRSTPYGFGLDVEALTPSRWAILAALGLTRTPQKLRSP